MTQSQDEKQGKGALRNDQDRLMFGEGFSFSGYERDPLYLNTGAKKFVDISGVSGIDSVTDGRAGVFADFDNDGDLDVFSTVIQGQSHLLFRNNVGQDGNWLRVSLEGTAGETGGREAYGAVVRVKSSAGTLTKIKSGGSGFISQHDPRLLFGLGRDAQAASVEVTWPGNKVERFEGDFRAGSSVLLRRGAGRAERLKLTAARLPDPLTRDQMFARGLKVNAGQQLPELLVKTPEGEIVQLRQRLQPGRRMLINVWATWCLPCRKEMPELEKLRPGLAANKIDLVGLNVDSDPKADLRGFLREHRVGYPIYVGGVPSIERLYATDELSVPMSILVDDQGVVQEVFPGWSEKTQKRFAALSGRRE